MEMTSETNRMLLLMSNASVLRSNHVINGRRHSFSFKIASLPNGTLLGQVTHRQYRKPPDDEGALYYVVAVIALYGLSIVMIIASYIRKNKSDRKLNRYLKEMERLRKREFQMQLLTIASGTAAGGKATTSGSASRVEGEGDREKCVLSLKCLPHHKHKGPRNTFSTDNNKMVLELPATAMSYMTDSDNETSTEGDGYSTPGYTHWDTDSRRSISRKDSGDSYVTDMELDAPSSGGRRKQVEGGWTCAQRSLSRRDSLASIKGTRVVLVQPGESENADACQQAPIIADVAGGGEGGEPEKAITASIVELPLSRIVRSDRCTAIAGSGEAKPGGVGITNDKPIKSVRLLLPEEEISGAEAHELRISDV